MGLLLAEPTGTALANTTIGQLMNTVALIFASNMNHFKACVVESWSSSAKKTLEKISFTLCNFADEKRSIEKDKLNLTHHAVAGTQDSLTQFSFLLPNQIDPLKGTANEAIRLNILKFLTYSFYIAMRLLRSRKGGKNPVRARFCNKTSGLSSQPNPKRNVWTGKIIDDSIL
ncbi:Dynein Heavy Chain 14, Axonemal [Manis pentadactyla]|nr:Dynein Heavy Chain 14, Axonemal [Manis pentadactyla]